MSQGGLYHISCDLARTVSVGLSHVGRPTLPVALSNLIISMKGVGEGRIRATWGWISVDRGSKATLPLTIPRRVFKSSAKDSTRRSVGIVLQGGPHGSSTARASPTTRAFGGRMAPTAGRQTGGGHMRRF